MLYIVTTSRILLGVSRLLAVLWSTKKMARSIPRSFSTTGDQKCGLSCFALNLKKNNSWAFGQRKNFVENGFQNLSKRH